MDKNALKTTLSLCPECYKRIPAVVYECSGSVYMEKECSRHGIFESMVERDSIFYRQCMMSGPSRIYDGYFLDVTERCNLECKYCYYSKSSYEPDIDDILQEASMHAHLGPIILTGGEPSLRSDLPEIIKKVKEIAPVRLLTNGTHLNLDKIVPLLEDDDNNVHINISIHKESDGADIAIIKECVERGIKLESVLFVIDNVNQIDNVLSFCEMYKDAIFAVRIKAATKLWDEDKPKDKIFVSDMINYTNKRYSTYPLWFRGNMTSFFNTMINDIIVMFVSWYDVNNVDLLDINCAPYYKAKTGHIENIVTSCLINEGMKKGYLDGRKICQ